MNLTKDTYEYIMNFADDSTILNMLSTNKKFREEKLFEKVLENRYPYLPKYRKEKESFVNFYIRMVYYIAKLKESYGIVYTQKLGNPAKYYKKLIKLYEKERLLFVQDADNWYGNMPIERDLPFDLNDPDHYSLNKTRKEILNMGGRVIPANQLPAKAKQVWRISKEMQKEGFEKLGYDKFYEILAERFKRLEE